MKSLPHLDPHDQGGAIDFGMGIFFYLINAFATLIRNLSRKLTGATKATSRKMSVFGNVSSLNSQQIILAL